MMDGVDNEIFWISMFVNNLDRGLDKTDRWVRSLNVFVWSCLSLWYYLPRSCLIKLVEFRKLIVSVWAVLEDVCMLSPHLFILLLRFFCEVFLYFVHDDRF